MILVLNIAVSPVESESTDNASKYMSEIELLLSFGREYVILCKLRTSECHVLNSSVSLCSTIARLAMWRWQRGNVLQYCSYRTRYQEIRDISFERYRDSNRWKTKSVFQIARQ